MHLKIMDISDFQKSVSLTVALEIKNLTKIHYFYKQNK